MVTASDRHCHLRVDQTRAIRSASASHGTFCRPPGTEPGACVQLEVRHHDPAGPGPVLVNERRGEVQIKKMTRNSDSEGRDAAAAACPAAAGPDPGPGSRLPADSDGPAAWVGDSETEAWKEIVLQ